MNNRISDYRKRVSNDTLFRVGGNLANRLLIMGLIGSVGLFIAYPLIMILIRSFQESGGGYGLSVYQQVWQQYRTTMWSSIFLAVITAVLSTLVSIGTALVLSTTRGWVRVAAMTLLLLTMVSPPFVSSLAYIQLYGRRGWITYRLLRLSLDPYNAWGVILMQTISFAPLNALFLNGLLTKIDGNALRSARDLGAHPKSLLKDIVLPLIRPGILVSLLLSFVRSMADFGTPIIIGGRFSTIAAEIYLQFTGYSNLEKASALNMVLIIPSLIAFFYYRRMMRRSEELSQAGRGKQEQLELSLRKAGPMGILAILLTLLLSVMMILQYTAIFFSGFLQNSRDGYILTTRYLQDLLRIDTSTILRSVQYALIVSLVGTSFAMLFAYYMDRRKIRGRNFFDGVATLPYMIPGVSFGIGYILAFNNSPLKLTGTAIIVLANMLFKQLPTSIKISSAALSQIPSSMESAARDLGAGQFAILRDIFLPSMKSAFLSCFVYNFSSSMTTAGAILFLITPSRKLAVFKLFDSVYSGDYATASLIATMIIMIVLFTEGLAYFFTREGRIFNVSSIKPSA
ncbi:MAG: iron ABC transporter permease [Clostridiaceae bacterium]